MKLAPHIPDCMIGLEIHVQLSTNSKLFCPCSTRPGEDQPDDPNSRVCPICLGHPGSKPTPNAAAVEAGVKIALALGCSISPALIFSRKSYFYPDMSKNFQITQFEEPLGRGGGLSMDHKEVGLIRVHVEEDPAALVHSGSMVLVDYNRSGLPLVEIVTEPALSSPNEAREFMRRLLSVLEYLEVYDSSWCALKADVNISIKESNFTRVEIKNVTGFKEIEQALIVETARQSAECSDGKKIKQETRGWDAQKQITYLLREKESEEDYGYIIEPDLVSYPLPQAWVLKIQEGLPELSAAKAKRFSSLGVKPHDAKVIAADKALAELFQQVAGAIDPVLAAKWIRRELVRVLNFAKKSLPESGITHHHVIDLLRLVEQKKITDTTGQRLMERLVEAPFDICKAVESESLAAVVHESALEEACNIALQDSPDAVMDFKSGEEKALHFIVGKVMAKTKGTADPGTVRKILERILKGK